MTTKPQSTIRVIDLLLEQNYISEDDATKAKEQKTQAPVAYLISQGIINKEIVGQAIGEYYDIPYLSLSRAAIPKSTLTQLPKHLAEEMRSLLYKESDEEIVIATDSPHKLEINREVLNDIFPGKRIIFRYSLPNEIDEAMTGYQSSIKENIENIIESGQGLSSKIFTAMVEEALKRQVSDIHMEPREDEVLIRFRIDGSLVEITNINHEVYQSLLNHIKILSNLRIDVHYSPQDGAIRFKTARNKIDLRVSLVPLLTGEKCVIRILASYTQQMTLDDLGLAPKQKKLIAEAAKSSYGMILTTGPTGSGKTTTLYSVLRQLNTPDVNITTIEDPVEYRVEGINQIQVNKDKNITFASGLRSIVRQDPNIILVGEIRDQETAEIAVNASLTGHLLLSTFHANDAASTIPRLIEMGTETFLLSSTLKLIIAQRLARKICTYCKFSYDYTQTELAEMIPDHKKYFKSGSVRLFKGKGCEHCNSTGFIGRVGVFEMVYITEKIQDLIIQKSDSNKIWKAAQEDGAESFFDDGMRKVQAGLISLEELIRVAPQTDEVAKIYE